MSEDEIEAALARLTTAEQVQLATGRDLWHLHGIGRIGLRPVAFSDGPAGVRGTVWDEREPSISLPCGSALAATWSTSLARAYGAVLGREARRKGVDVVLGPTINLHRTPLGGRHFECLSEDPHLSGELALAYVRGVQAEGVAACPKHYVANDCETDRFTVSVELSDRALHEVYLVPFERAVLQGQAWTIMSAYNAVRGVTMSENELLTDPLISAWGFDGVVVSDWNGVRSVAAAAAGQHLSMPGPDGPWADGLAAAVAEGAVPEAAVRDKARRILRLAGRVGAWPDAPQEQSREDTNPGAAAQRAADEQLAHDVQVAGTVLLSNDGVLPLRGGTTVALIGPAAARPRIQGGGSATVVPLGISTPLDELSGRPGITVVHAQGLPESDELLPFDASVISDPETGLPGARVRFVDDDGEVSFSERRETTRLMWLRDAPDNGAPWFEVEMDLLVTQAGPIDLGFAVRGQCDLSVDGVPVLLGSARADDDHGGAVAEAVPHHARCELEEGTHRLRYRHLLPGPIYKSDGRVAVGALTFLAGWRAVPSSTQQELVAEAVEQALAADVAIVVVGTDERQETEGRDRTTLALSADQDALVEAVTAANPRTVVVVNAGAPVLMPWRGRAAAVLLTWFGGQRYGSALADVLTGVAEPGGRLPTTWPAEEADVPALEVAPQQDSLTYREGIHVGYRGWEQQARRPAFPFGHGLGYTQWRYDGIAVAPDGDGAVVTVAVTNVGDRAGGEVVQVYLRRPDSAIDRPARWLAGFATVGAEAGENATVAVTVPRRAFEHWTAEGWQVEPGGFEVLAGPSSAESSLQTSWHVVG